MKITIATVVLISSLISLQAHPDSDEVSLSHMTANGKSTIHKIQEAEAKKLPEWDPESGKAAPLSLDAAIKKGKEWMKKKNPNMDDFKVRSINLAKVGYGSIPNRWFYKIDFDPVIGDQKLFGSRFTAVILMDGTVIEPIVRDAEKY
jgi:hypothetical protein